MDARRRRWERATDGPLTVVALAFLVVYAVPILAPAGHPALLRACAVGERVVWVVFAVDFVAALAVLESERKDPNTTIHTFGDAVWWAAATVTTVGYGDLVPVTTEGRVISLALMVTGIGLVGVVTAALASWFVEKVGRVERDTRRAAWELEELVEEVRGLRAELAAVRASAGGPDAGVSDSAPPAAP